MATLDDILTTQKNGVVAINALNNTTSFIAGKVTTDTVTTKTLVVTGPGILVSFSVTVAGSAAGTINNAQAIGLTSASNVLVTTPASIANCTPCGCYFTSGLVISPGTGQSINVTYAVTV